MAAKKPKVGDAVVHHGRPHTIANLPKRAKLEGNGAVVVEMVVFENDSYRVLGQASELLWSEGDGAWYLPGRVLSRDERLLYEALIGARPPAETHLVARGVLDATDFADVPRARLVGVIKGRTVARLKDDAGQWAETEEAWTARAEAYADACLAHCAELKEARHG